MPKKQAPTRAIDKLRSHYRSERRSIYIEEIDETFYFGPLTKADEQAVDDRMEMQEGADPAHRKNLKLRTIYMLIHKAETEDGAKAFQFGDQQYLMHEADAMILNRLIACMYGGILPLTKDGVEEAKKESAKSPASTSA